MKIICENYMNTLMNKFLGDEVNVGRDDNEREKEDDSIVMADNDIVISKFQKENVYNQGVFKTKRYLYIFLGSIITMVIFEIYFIITLAHKIKELTNCQLYIDFIVLVVLSTIVALN